ncbi:DUF2829 domain-containing protein [Paraburkholderia sp. SIMBA_050]
MTRYVGTKAVMARAMTRGEYNAYRGWTIPANEDPNEPGYLVEYLDGGKPNIEGHQGYVSWSPADVFERSYQPGAAKSFGDALIALKAGMRVARVGWNGKGLWLSLRLVKGDVMDCGTGGEFPEADWIGMKTADNKFVPWLASQTDVLANDWVTL